jgi:vacuolar protein sorting-associated protein 13A/C
MIVFFNMIHYWITLSVKIYKGIRNTTTVFDENDIAPVRLPRYVGRDGILKVYIFSRLKLFIYFFFFFFCEYLLKLIIIIQPYDQREALGQSWLKGLENGKYFNEEYIAHLGNLHD